MRLKSSLITVLLCSLTLVPGTRADISSGLVLYLPLNETSGTTAFDSSGLSHDATFVNAPAGEAQWTNGWVSGGANINNPFDPALIDYLTIPSTPDLSFDTVKHFTLACWVKLPTAQIAGASLIAHGTGGGGEQYDLDINANKFRIVTRFPAASGTPPAVALS
ncbi:MAG: hypothetical protein ABIQ35_11130, partial [Verrucomicrobiota bacterium]